MLKRFLAISLIVSLIASNFSRLFEYAGFELNRDYIAANLCVNRNKPWLHCNGKCYFMKKIRQAQEKQASDERQAQKNLFQEANYTRTAAIKFHTHLLQVIPIPNNRITLPQSLQSIFRPPQVG